MQYQLNASLIVLTALMSSGFRNPEAGDHPVASDPRELEAGAVAEQRSWREFPYYEARFGERGRRFGASDTGWLLTLCDRERADAIRQAQWLGAVLSSRGMPQLLLENHLVFLRDALPKDVERYDVLVVCSRRLARDRRSVMSQHEFDALAAGFTPAAIPRFGEILVSAAIDEALGIEHAVDSIEVWACDKSRFDGKWIAAVRTTIAAARVVTSRYRSRSS